MLWEHFVAVKMDDFDLVIFTHLQEAVIEKFVKYYKAIFHHNSWYFANFVMCELLNFILLFAQFQMTDNFLSKKFRWWVELKLGPCVRLSKVRLGGF